MGLSSAARSPGVVGSAPSHVPEGDVLSWIFSNPFRRGSLALDCAPSAAAACHYVPAVAASKPFLVDLQTGACLDFGQALFDSERWARGLARRLYGPSQHRLPSTRQLDGDARISSDVILIQLPNCVQLAITLFGTWRAGLTASLASPTLSVEELSWVVTCAKPAVIVSTAACEGKIEAALQQQADRGYAQSVQKYFVSVERDTYDLSWTQRQPLFRSDDWKSLFLEADDETSLALPILNVRQQDAAVVLWSSGTSGRSKGVVLSHRALTSSVLRAWHSNLTYGSDERWLAFVPFCHIFGLAMILLVAPCCGATIYLQRPYHPHRMLEAISIHSISALHMAPPVLVFLSSDAMVKRSELSSVKSLLSGGAPLAQEIIDKTHQHCGLRARRGYGLSEATSVTEEDGEFAETGSNGRGSVGRAMYGVELKISPPQDPNTTLGLGEEGEISIRSPSLMTCYLNNEQATQESMVDGWFRTGDVGKIDKDGRLYITDRLKEMIKVKGFQVSPSDLENILCGSPLVQDAAVGSIFDDKMSTELPRAYIVLKHDATDDKQALVKTAHAIREWVEVRVAKYKWLRGNIVFVRSIPRSPNGKTLRRLLKETHGINVDIYSANTLRPSL